jgi:glycosyltransferase involved in cell wall biosynthesis
MIAYTNYSSDARVRREAETIAALPGFQVTFIALKEGLKPRVYKMRGVWVHELNIEKYQGKRKSAYIYSYLKFLFKAFNLINKKLFASKADVVHVHNMPNFMVFSALLPRLIGKKVILDIHDSIPETYLTKFTGSKRTRLLFKLLCFEESICCRFAQRIVCVNHVQKNVLAVRGLSVDKILISLNVPDPEIFSRKTDSWGSRKNNDIFNLVYHGTVTKRLGIDLVIQAVAAIKEQLPNLYFHVMGTGDDLIEFIELSQSLGIKDRIHFNNRMEPVEKVSAMVANMDAGVIGNRKNIATELMLPVKMLEYIALGIPVVAPRLRAIQYYFTEEMMQYYEPENIDSLVSAICSIVQEKEKRQHQIKAARTFFETYGWDKHKEGLIDLYMN